MFFGDPLPVTLAVWKPRRAIPSEIARISRPPVSHPRTFRPGADNVPRSMIVAPETLSVLTAASGFARGRLVNLQMAIEPGLAACVDAAEYRTCLHQLILAAIGRASSGVLVTAMRRADSVEVAVLDDGGASAGAPRASPAQPAAEAALPVGAVLTTDYRPEYGTTVLLRMPPAD
jgi:hypothetical protein